MRPNTWLLLATLNGALAVAAGAFAAHGLNGGLNDGEGTALFRTAARYQMWHALALLAVAALARSVEGSRLVLNLAGWAFLAGIVLFSGGLYLLVLTGPGLLVFAVPVGGGAFIFGWLALAWYAVGAGRARRQQP